METKRPLIIAHRGASGYSPEHTQSAYERAIDQGADYIEPDLVMTKDGHLVCRHENEISETTDVAARPEFAGRRRVRIIDGKQVEGWFTEDFTLAELRSLTCKERLPQLRPNNAQFDGAERILTFWEAINLARDCNRVDAKRFCKHIKNGVSRVGLYPELKHAAYFESLGLDLVKALVSDLRGRLLDAATAPVFVQCFEVAPLKRLRAMSQVPIVQLLSASGGPADDPSQTYAQMATPAGLKAIAEYAHGIGVEKTMIVPRGADGRSLAPTSLIKDAHDAGLLVHVWTFRNENAFLPLEYQLGEAPGDHGDAVSELQRFFELGIDGAFCDFPDVGVLARGRS